MNIELKIYDKEFYKRYVLPHYPSPASAGMDLLCTQKIHIGCNGIKPIRTGLAINIKDIPIMGMILPKAVMRTKGLIIANTMTIIDGENTDEIIITMLNNNMYEDAVIEKGEKIATLVFVPTIRVNFNVVNNFTFSHRVMQDGWWDDMNNVI